MVDFLSRLRSLGVKLWLEGDALRYQGPKEAVTKELLAEISQRKQQLIAFLRQVNLETKAGLEPILPVTRETGNEFPLSYSQQSMWFFDQFTKGNSVFNISNAVRMKGKLDKETVKKVLQELVRRYESLRTTFKNVNGIPVQVINNTAEVDLAEIDIRQIPKPELELELKKILKEEARRSFDLQTGPLFRFCLFIPEENDYVLSMTIHHIISDAWSNAIFIGEFIELYEALHLEKTGENRLLPELPIQFADYVIWERNRLQGQTLEDLLYYWRKQLAHPTTLQLPTDRVRPKSQTYEGGFEPVTLSQGLSQKLIALSNKEGVTIFMLILAAFQTLLYRYSGQEDVFTGTVVANRNRKEIANLIGYFMNTLVLRTNFEGDPSFIQLLRQVKQTTLDAYTYQELPFDKILEELKPERDVSRTPLFQVMFILHNTQKVELKLPQLEMEQLDVESGMAPFDLRLQLTETGQGLKGGFDYNSSLFHPVTIQRIAGHLQNLLEGIVANPALSVSRLPLITSVEQEQILSEFNHTKADYPAGKVIHQLFEEQVAKNPENIAAIYQNSRLTYRELNQKANQLARHLRQKGVKAESIVGIMLERSLEMIIGIMAIVKSGGAYLPIDPNYPKERIDFILEDSGVSVLLSHQKFAEIGNTRKVERIFLEDESLYNSDHNNLSDEAGPRNLAYVIYTSGSTGKPKGTLIEHHSLINRLNWMQKKYPIGPQDIILQKTPFTFDVSVWEIFWWSIQGAGVCFLEPGAEKDPSQIVKAIQENRITTIHFVPSMLNTFLEYLKENGESRKVIGLKQVFASGEALTTAQVRLFKALLSIQGIKLANLYGPTEATIDVSYFDCDTGEDLETIPIGKPIDNIQLLIVDKNRQLQPIGVPGELCICGVGLARKYLNRPELTAEKFVPNPFGTGNMYRTGDFAKWRLDGNIEYLGRIDFQVKIRGFRIELGEIERVLGTHPLIKECVVTAWEKQPGNVHLVGYIVTGNEEKTESSHLQTFLEKILPEYMVPRLFVFLEALPLSANGKIDRKALPVPVLTKRSEQVAPGNDTEKILAEIWKEELGLDSVGINDNFFEVGGHSLLLTRINSRIKKQFGQELSLIDMFTYSTINTLAKHLAGGSQQTSFLLNEERLQKQREAKLMRRQMQNRERKGI